MKGATMQKVIAIDFDGTLCENKYPEIGLPRWGVIFKALSEQENGAALILWTCRTGKELNDAVEACAKWGLTFDAVNKNLPSWVDTWNNDPRKVGATEYWDDRAKSTTDAKDFGKLESKVNGYEIETRPIGSSPCSFETRVTHEDFNNGMPVTVNHYKNLHDAAKGQFNWMKKAEGGFNKLYDIYSFCDDESKHAGCILAARHNNIVWREIVECADVLLHSGFKTAQAFVLRNDLLTLERIG